MADGDALALRKLWYKETVFGVGESPKEARDELVGPPLQELETFFPFTGDDDAFVVPLETERDMKVVSMGNDYYFVNFEYREDRACAINSAPWTVQGNHLAIRAWVLYFQGLVGRLSGRAFWHSLWNITISPAFVRLENFG
ncbi:hypothetical protein CRG98_017513 [Punica granatum]|uniref:DUF4283 domain-containing protein n=1 Tax=Punica granatum TaxID=22663 RepID=A0A2I0K1Z0_PUNGR|nr:hypothetical protein CRG98_017513 [Punica granatum]